MDEPPDRGEVTRLLLRWRAGDSATWLESHFRWHLRTFWYGLLWVALCRLLILGTVATWKRFAAGVTKVFAT